MESLNPTSPIGASFVRIAPSIHFRRAKDVAVDADSESTLNLQDPDLILLFTWTGAQPHHTANYASGYTKLFPSSSMIITSSMNDLVHRSSAKKQCSLIPAILTLSSSHLDSNFLVHCFSETGAHKCVQFAKSFLKSTGLRLPVSAVCLDSARGTLHSTDPTKPTMAEADRESTKGTPALHTATSLLAYSLSASCWTTYPFIGDAFIDPSQIQFDKSRNALNDAQLWDVRAPRCYLFSKSDKLTDPRSVIEHARNAEKLGARVVTVTDFEQKPNHCSRPGNKPITIAAATSNAERYWATIQRTWDASTSTSTTSAPTI